MTTSVRNISDTARWVAYFRACETERADALFRDPYAKRLAGDRGFEIAKTLVGGNKHEWAWVARTLLFDRFISRAVIEGADLVLNLGAGLDARPYRMDLPQGLRWIEADLPEIVAYKQSALAEECSKCDLERVSLDLANREERRKLFARADGCAKKVLVMTEGLLIYLTNEEVVALAQDLGECSHFENWVIDLASPGQLKLMQQTTGKQLSQVGAPFKFGPPDGPAFFSPYGWKTCAVEGMLNTAAKLGRAPAELLTLLPEPKVLPPHYPWTGVCLLEKARA